MLSGNLDSCRDLTRIIIGEHVETRLLQRGGDVGELEHQVRLAHSFVRNRRYLIGIPLALQGGAVTPIVVFRQGGSRAIVATVLEPYQALKPGTFPVEV